MDVVSLPKISIVTPSFNQGRYLEETIDSVLSQNYPNLEYIIMDGGSTDNSIDIIKKYEKFLSYWQSNSDGGQYAGIQAGFQRSSGEVMAWLNSDDKYHSNALYTVAYIFTQQREVEWLVGRSTWWGEGGELTGIIDHLPVHNRRQFIERRFDNSWIQQESTFWRRSLWNRAGGHLRTDLQYAGDLELWLRFFRIADLHTVNALLGGYRIHGNQKAGNSLGNYVAEANGLIDEEIEYTVQENNPRMSEPPVPVEVDLCALRDFACNVMASGQRPNFSAHQVFVLLQNQSDSLHRAVVEMSDELGALRKERISIEEIKNSISWRITAPMRRVLNLIRMD